MNKQRGKRKSQNVRRAGAMALAAAMVVGTLGTDFSSVSAASYTTWKSDITSALDAAVNGMGASDNYGAASEALTNAYNSLEGSATIEGLKVLGVTEDSVTLQWNPLDDTEGNLLGYNVYWADKNLDTTEFLLLDSEGRTIPDDAEETITIPAADLENNTESVTFTVKKSTFYNLYFKVAAVTKVGIGQQTEAVKSPKAVEYNAYLEDIDRGMTATITDEGVYLSWRLLASEVDGYSETGLTGVNFNVYRNGEKIATVTDSTNYLDAGATALKEDTYKLVPVDADGDELTAETCTDYVIFTKDADNKDVAYIDIPIQQPADTTIAKEYGITADQMKLDGYTITDSGYTSVDDKITYIANDSSVADVDGDGQYEYFVKWDPSLSKDVSQFGYTGKTYIDCYELDGTLLWRLDMGINIRSGAHYTEYDVFDYDKDGKAELIVKTAPGTRMIKYELKDGKNVKEADGSLKVASEDYVTISAEDAAAGVTNGSNYVFTNDDYRNYLIDVFQDWGVWSRYSEETVKEAIEGYWDENLVTMFSVSDKWRDTSFCIGDDTNSKIDIKTMTAEDIKTYIPDYQEGDTLVNVCLRDENGAVKYYVTDKGLYYPIMKTVRVEDVKDYYGGYDLASVNKDGGYTKEEAAILADYFLKHFQYRMRKHNLETYEGYVITGPEYVSLFDCSNGEELDTQDWYYGREDDGMLWGDYAMDFMEPGNRCDRFNCAVAYLDGETPSAIMGRGYYTRTTMVAYNVVDKKLSVAGAIDSGWTVMTNPFNDSPHGYDGCDPVNGKLSGQGDHYIAVADVDLDGRQDIINGGAIVSYDMDAKDLYLYSSGTGDNATTGAKDIKYGHGDAIHITDINPDRPGIEIVSCFEGASSAPYNWALRDAETNTALFGVPGSSDFGRIIIGDVLQDVRGLEIDTKVDCNGNPVTLAGVSNNMNIKWSADMSTQFISGAMSSSGSENYQVKITGNADGKSYTFLTAPSGWRTNNSTKGNPNLVADLFGDSREELVLRNAENNTLRIYMNTEVSAHKNYTLMQNLQYRVGIASQNSAYNQPAYTDYYYASDTDWEYVTVPNQKKEQEPGNVGGPEKTPGEGEEPDSEEPDSEEPDSEEPIKTPDEGDEPIKTPDEGDEPIKTPDEGDEPIESPNEGDEKTTGEGSEVDTSAKADAASGIIVSTDTAVEGMTTQPIGDYLFDFGNKISVGNGSFKDITNNAYDESKGYGFLGSTAGINYDGHNDTSLISSGTSDFDRALHQAVQDAGRDASMEFAIDLPAGTYVVNLYNYTTWNLNQYTGSKYYINDVEIGTFNNDAAEARTPEQCAMSAKVVLPQDGQIVVKGEKGTGKLAFFAAITVNEYVIDVPDYSEDAWTAFTEAAAEFKIKASMMEDDSQPEDYDAIVVTKMLNVLKAAKAVRYMPLVDIADGDAAYALAEEAVANKGLYTAASIAELQKAMEDYNAVKADLTITEEITEVIDMLNHWLEGIDTENVPEAFSLYVDFDTTCVKTNGWDDSLPTDAPGYVQVGGDAGHPSLDLYSEELGYGLLESSGGRNRGGDDYALADWIGGTFAVDLPAGNYRVVVTSGELGGVAKDDVFSFYKDSKENEAFLVSEKITAEKNSYVRTAFEFTLDKAEHIVMTGTHMMTVTFEQIVPLVAASADKTALAAAITAAKAVDETKYTAESYAAVKSALETAEAVNADENASQSDVDDAAAALNKAVEALVGKTPTEGDNTEKPSTEKPSTEKPSTEKPSTETPGTQTPSTQAPGSETPGAAKGTPINSGKNKFVVTTTAGSTPSVEFKGSSDAKVKIPATVVSDGVTYKVTSVAASAFKNNKKITSVTIGANVTKIGANAFSGCTKLKTVTIGKGVTTIGASAFKGCTALTKIKIPGNVKTIGANAFSGCKKLATVTIGAKVTSIGNSAFANCAALKKVTVPNKVKKIGNNAFSGCKNLTSVTIGTGVTSIGTQAFKGCGKLTKITIKSTALKTVGKNAFKGINAKATIKVPGKKLTAYKNLLKGKGQGKNVKITK